MKKLLPVVVVVGILVASGATYFAVRYAAGHYLNNQQKQQTKPVVACGGKHAHHVVTIHNDALAPSHIQATVCDTLKIINTDDRLREMAFGVHDKHQAYDGISEKLLEKNQSLTVTLNQTGTYLFHDHFQDEVAGTFTVTKP